MGTALVGGVTGGGVTTSPSFATWAGGWAGVGGCSSLTVAAAGAGAGGSVGGLSTCCLS